MKKKFNRALILVVCVAVVFVDVPDLFSRGAGASEEIGRDSLKPISGIVMVDGGVGWGLALHDNGAVFAWGDNVISQLGNGTNDPSLTPKQVFGLGPGSGVIAISAGNSHAMALEEDGTVLAWGSNILGQLGDGTLISKSTPVRVTGLANVVAISAGFTHSLALKADGTVWCWGRNALAACGTGTTGNPLTAPVQVHGVNNVGFLTGVTKISAGANSSMALGSDGTVYTWGNNSAGQIGNGTVNPNAPQLTPFEVLQNGIAIANASISGANSSYALTSDGTVFAWGANNAGQLGDGTSMNRSTPVQVSGLGPGSGVMALAMGQSHALALKVDGTVLAWGNNNNGQLGDGTKQNKNVPIPILNPGGDSAVTAIAGGDLHSYARTSEGRVLAWGNNSIGQLGDGTFFGQLLPVQTSGLDANVKMVSAGNSFSLALKEDGTVLGWGDNSSGQLGDGTTTGKIEPVEVSTLGIGSGVKVISAGFNHSLALRENGEVLAWGGNNRGQLGNNSLTPSLTPVQVSGLGPGSDVIAISARDSGSLALKGDGTVLAWGLNDAGQVGDGTTTTPRLTPVQVHGLNDVGLLTGVTAIAGGGDHCFALTSDGTVLAWGLNALAQLGDGTTSNERLTPVQVHGLNDVGFLTGVTAIGAYGRGGFALKSDGTVLGWGANLGAVGNGTTSIQLFPVQTSGLGEGSGVISVKGGLEYALALKFDGTALAWGNNSAGQLGDGTTSQRLTPVSITALSNVKELSAFPGRGSNHSLALLFDGSVLAWGANNVGQLGDGTVYTKNLTPSPVLYNPVTIYDRR